MRDRGKQSNPLLTNPEQGAPPGDVSAHGHPDSAYLLWQQQQNQGQQAVGEGDALSEHELLEEAAAAQKGPGNPVRAERADQRRMKERKESFPQSGTDLPLKPDSHHDVFTSSIYHPRILYSHIGYGR